MALVQDNQFVCKNLATQNLKQIPFSHSNGRDAPNIRDAQIKGQLEQTQSKSSLLDSIRGSSTAASGSKTPFLVILTADQARMIYSLRSESTAQSFELRSVAGKSSLVAELYGVSPKTIRDVWNRKTWTQVRTQVFHLSHYDSFDQMTIFCTQVTRPLWTAEEAEHYEREHMPADQVFATLSFRSFIFIKLLKISDIFNDTAKTFLIELLSQRAALGHAEPDCKRRGRPPGSKDARPRKRRSAPVPVS